MKAEIYFGTNVNSKCPDQSHSLTSLINSKVSNESVSGK